MSIQKRAKSGFSENFIGSSRCSGIGGVPLNFLWNLSFFFVSEPIATLMPGGFRWNPVCNQRTFYLRSGWRGSSLSGLLTVKGTGMREQGSLKGEGTHRGNLCVEIFKPNLPVNDIQRKNHKNSTWCLPTSCRHLLIHNGWLFTCFSHFFVRLSKSIRYL